MQQIGRYTIEREAGRGAMGIVYLAVDPVLDRRVALKTVRLPEALDEGERAEYIRRFYREAQAAGKLSHPGIVTIYDAGFDETSRSHFIAMEFIAGVTLKQFISDGLRLAPRQAAFIAAGVAEALDYAHAQGVVHRDIKPANIILTDRGAVKIADFGIAKVPSSHLTMEGTYLGTPAYTSPEQVLGRVVDGRSDLFSLGIVLYELLAGRKPFPADHLGQLFHAIAYEPHPPLGEILPGCPPALAAVVDRALHKDASARYAGGLDFARDLKAFLGPGESASLETDGPLDAGGGAQEAGHLAQNPLDDLLAYLEETTRRLAPENTPVSPGRKAAPGLGPGFRGRALQWLGGGRGTGWLARELKAPLALFLVAGTTLAAAAGLGTLWMEARENSSANYASLAEPVPAWRGEIRTGRAELEAGEAERALARFQDLRLRRPQSPALADLTGAALEGLLESLAASLPPQQQVQRLQVMGEVARREGDTASAAEFFQAALRIEPQNPAAAAALEAVSAVPSPTPPPPAPEGPSSPALRLRFDSPVPKGYILVHADEAQILRRAFSFNGKDALEGGIRGRLDEPLPLQPGRHTVKVWVTVKGKPEYTVHGSLPVDLVPGRTAVLAVGLDQAEQKLSLSLK